MAEQSNQSQRPNQNAAAQSEKTVRGTVARGRTVDIPDPNTRQVVGHTPEGRPIQRCATRSYGPGHEVELPAREIDSLRSRGFLIDPGVPLPPLAEGPHYTETGPHASAS